MQVTIYHNPRCSKSRQTLQILQDRSIAPTIIEYLKEPPNRDTLEQVLNLLNMQPRDLMRKNETVYTELDLANPSLSRDQLIDAMLANPVLIERPIVIVDNCKVALGRPPENVLRLIEP